jgi:hypothetical protein
MWRKITRKLLLSRYRDVLGCCRVFASTNVENNFASFDTFEELHGLLVRDVVTHMPIDCQYFVARSQLSALDGLSIRHDALDEDAESTARTVRTSNYRESELLLALSLLECHRLKGAMRTRLCSSRQRTKVCARGQGH